MRKNIRNLKQSYMSNQELNPTAGFAFVGNTDGIAVFRDAFCKLHFVCEGTHPSYHPDDTDASGYVSIIVTPTIIICTKDSKRRILRAFVRRSEHWLNWSGWTPYFSDEKYCVRKYGETTSNFDVYMVDIEEVLDLRKHMPRGMSIRQMLCTRAAFAFGYSKSADDPLIWKIMDVVSWQLVSMKAPEGSVVTEFDDVLLEGSIFKVTLDGVQYTI